MKVLAAFILLSIFKKVNGSSIIGINPSERELYEPNVNEETGEEYWHCLGDPSIILRYDQINDNYCDCPDGSDEPGTNACPYNPERKFYCSNDGHFPGYLENFKLNDGVCDYEVCCDGSDEYFSGKCENKCKEIHKQFLKYKEKAHREIETSLVRKQTLANKAKEDRMKLQERFDELRKKLEIQELELDSLRKSLEENGNQDDAAEELVYTRLSPHIKELHTNIESERNNVQDYSKKVTYLESVLSHLIENYNPNFNDLAVKESVHKFQDYLSNKEGNMDAGKDPLIILDTLTEESKQLSYNHEQSFKPNEKVNAVPNFGNMMHYYYSSIVQSYLKDSDENHPSSGQRYSSGSLEDIQKLENHIESLNSEISSLANDLESDYGNGDIFRSIRHLWVNTRFGGYGYNLGFLDSIYQDGVLIGKYSKLEDNKLIYKLGAKCWNGPQRSGIVELICGPSNDLISVSEPEKCEYYFEVISPVVCEEITEEDLIANFKINHEIL